MSQDTVATNPGLSYPLLRIESGSQAGREFFAGKTVLIGRGEECDLRLIDEKVSRRHAEINPDPKGGAILRDLGSVNGTLVDGERVTTASIPDRGRFKIGSTEIVFLERPESERKTQLADRAADSRSQVECVLPQGEADILAGTPSSDEITSVYRLARTLPGTLDPKELSRRWLADVCKELKADSGALLTRRGGEENVIVCPETGPAPRLSRSVMERVLSTGDSLLVADLGESDLSSSKSLASSRVATLMAAPVPLSGDERAYVCIDRRGEKSPPFSQRELAMLAEAARALGAALDAARSHAQDVARLAKLAGKSSAAGQLIGRSPKFLACIEIATRAAPHTTPVLICGPTGSGKELLARLIHDESPRAKEPFIAVNCAALPEGLQESELFGHERGAFTGASTAREGFFRLADGGTLFLDEVGDLAQSSQVKLLRAVETGEFYPVGSSRPQRVNVRIVGATNVRLDEAVKSGKFRDDLLHRLNVIRIDLPSLAERGSDIRMLAEHVLSRKAIELKRPVRSISERAYAMLESYSWPGNIRELSNLIERAVVLSRGAQLDIGDFPAELGSSAKPTEAPPGQPITLAEAEKRAVLHALTFTNWQKTKAAEILGISWPTLQKKIQDYGLTQPKE
jgi:DNA-binding NtrC family response regulator/pSer/pThr/pTyr-binding forkhead associated (FHA) protein